MPEWKMPHINLFNWGAIRKSYIPEFYEKGAMVTLEVLLPGRK